MITCARLPAARSAEYSLPKPVPIFGRDAHGECPLDGPPLFCDRPAAGVWAKVGAPPGHSTRIQDQGAVDRGQALQLAARLDLAAPDAGAEGLRAQDPSFPPSLPEEDQSGGQRLWFPPPLAGEGQGGGPQRSA